MAFAPLPAPLVDSTERTFQVVASSYEFSPAEISVNPGDQVTIELISSDVVHGLYLDGYDLSIQADPGQTETLTFTADRSGTFRLRCSVTCGDLHPFMIGKLHVGSNTLLWRGIGFATLSVVALFVFKPSVIGKRIKQLPNTD
ncbi:MAG: cupredoxin domain-containing protein [Anaerolineales bacterium]|nr:cupredoxin domain-containing protein [Anaerolineales bacterium]